MTDTPHSRPEASLESRIAKLEAMESVRRLQSVYAFYMDASQGQAVPDLFTDDATARFFGGIFRGKESLTRFYVGHASRFLGLDGTPAEEPTRARMGEHLMADHVITVADDACSASMRVRHLLKAGWHETYQGQVAPGSPLQWYEGGVYENEYVKEDGVWKFKVLDFHIEYSATPEAGWAHTSVPFVPSQHFTQTYPDDPLGPDELMDPPPSTWPERRVLPYHYPHPVTGEWITVTGQRELRNP